MRDPIERQDAIDAIKASTKKYTGFMEMEMYTDDDAVEAIINLPSAQPDIIACGDCKHWICHDRRCGYWNHGVKPLDWCCHGERRTDE